VAPAFDGACSSNDQEKLMSSKSRKQQLEEMLASDPNDSFLRYGLAMEYSTAGEDEEAIRCLRELLARNADYVPAYLQAGRALIRQGADEDAREILRAGIVVAKRTGDEHAAGEMAGFLESLG
jgi:thioredoxin-like negative regulator of GroEL